MGADPVRDALTTAYVRKLISTKSRQLLRRPEFRRYDHADLEQDLLAHVLRQADRYDPARAGVNTFISRVVETAAAMLCRRRSRLKRPAGRGAISLEGTVLEHDGRRTPLSELVDEEAGGRRQGTDTPSAQERLDLSLDLADLLGPLPPEVRRIARMLARGGEASAARRLGISRRRVREAVQAIRRRLEEAGLTEI